ncbi:hypothetical protein FIBSPDRAFT_730105 [Athelia psychrophila]|uniref:Uncharacterized protein n=1 Tax=Athelia psychrophila TaxID=1759441 RepID=A0A166R4P5_9AGAM|nr:hypothetical protein FIBSPDRAFT_730105 [Fibularhizoctonia sp. CBS 109695]
MISRTDGYWARDYSLNLGWNNMRYIIETALLHGRLLNRTVILPSFVYARSCEYHANVCAQYVPMVIHGDAVHSEEWRDLPLEEQMSWRVPIGTMLNLTLLRATQPVITVSEYFLLHNIPTDAETDDGKWDRHVYHVNPGKFTDRTPSIYVLDHSEYDPLKVNRVDSIPDAMKRRGGWVYKGPGGGAWPARVKKSAVYRALESALPDKPRVLSWEQARTVLEHKDYRPEIASDQKMEEFLNEHGWEVLYTYSGAIGMDYIKNVVNPIRQVAPRDSLRGLREDYGHLTTDVVYLPGEIHYERKPGGLRFTTTEHRDVFSQLVLYHIRATDRVYELAAKLAARMQAMNGGRMWLGAHMRRGDFVRTNWAMEKTIEGHLERIKISLAAGRATLRAMQGTAVTTYDVPDAVPDNSIVYLSRPEETDKFYLATDERDRGKMAYLTAHGAVLIDHLLTRDDRREFGWELMLTDVLGLVEQAVLARASYFYAHAMSSYAGGTINMRAAAGLDPRTALID